MDSFNGFASTSISIYGVTPRPVQIQVSEGTELRTDSEIWAAFLNGDDQAYEMMFRQHYSLLLNYGLRFHNNEEDVKDYIQQLFVRLWESRKRLGKNNSIKSYLLASLRRMIHRGSKSKLKFLDLNSVAPSFHVKLAVENKFLKSQKEKEQVSYVSKLLESLPKRQREAIFLKFYGEHGFGEIAEIMGISTRVVYKLIYKALDNLSRQIADKNTVVD